MPVELVEIKFQAPKEMNDVRVCLVELLKDIKAGKTVVEITGENFNNLIEAVKGADKVSVEVKQEMAKSAVLAGHLGGEVIGVFL